MKTPLSRRAAVATAAVAAAASLVAGVGIVSASEETPALGCSGDQQYGFAGWGFGMHDTGAIVNSASNAAPRLPSSRSLPVDIAAGTYTIDTASYDGDDDRVDETAQPVEQFVLQFLDVGGSVIATTGATPDLADNVAEAWWTGGVGQVTLDRAATTVRALHVQAGGSDGYANSVMPVCVGVTLVAPPTTQPPTTSLSPTTTLPTTTLPTTTLAPTTSAATEVLAVQESEPATPVTATPQFNG